MLGFVRFGEVWLGLVVLLGLVRFGLVWHFSTSGFLMGGLALHDDLRFALEINTTMKGFFHHINP